MINTVLLYSTVLLLGYVLSYIAETSVSKSKTRVCIVILVFLLSGLSGFRRFDVGIDTMGYAQIFLGIDKYKGMEQGFTLFCEIIMRLFHSPVAMFFITAILINSLFIARYWSLRQISPMRYSFVIYYTMLFFSTMNGVRQWLAVAIIFYATKYIYSDKVKAKQYIKFILAIIIAVSFHTSALVAFIFFVPEFLKKANTSKQLLLKAVVIVGLPVLAIFAYNKLYTKYSLFIITDINQVSIGLMIPIRLLILVMIVAIEYRRLKNNKCDNILPLLLFLEFMTLLISSTGYFAQTASRMSWYFFAFTPVLYGLTLHKRQYRNFFQLGLKLGITVVYLYSYATIFFDATNKLVPFNFVWQ